MPCIQNHEHCLTENFAKTVALWVSVEPNIRWHYEVLMWSSQSDESELITQHVNVVLPVGHHEKLCFNVPSFEAGTVLLLKMCCHFIQWNV